MAADTPFGASFGNPRQYMGSTNIGQVLGAFLANKAGLIDLDDPTQKQVFDKSGLKGLIGQNVGNQLGLPMPAGSAPPPQFTPGNYDVKPDYSIAPVAPPQGMNTFANPVAPVNPQAQRDIPVPQPQNAPQQKLSGMEYKDVQGYGSLMEKAKMFAGLFA
jgi:hypothetical protein